MLGLGPCSLFFSCVVPLFSPSFSGFPTLCHMLKGQWNLSDYYVLEPKACKSWLSFGVHFARLPSGCLAADPSTPWVSLLRHASSNTHWIMKQKRQKQALESRSMSPKPNRFACPQLLTGKRSWKATGRDICGAAEASHWDHRPWFQLIHPDGHHDLNPT